ncbi:hypothetical protein HYT84_02220 [Candidatus Micrarchaeota archaeon]|nr:hypothetical protein [Candidatus Micrarchaeota archaeon]
MIENIYKGDYRLLAVIPILLIVASLFLIPNIKMGVDFSGGTLISLSLSEKVSAETLKANLENDGLIGTVRVFDSALGQQVEIELPQSEELTKAERLKGDFNSLLNQVISLEVQSSTDQKILNEYIQKKQELDSLANQMFGLAKSEKKADDFANLNLLQKEFSNSYNIVFNNYQNGIQNAINKYVKYNAISVQTVSPLLSVKFIEKAVWVVIGAGILSVIFVFLFIRELIPSLAVISGAVADIIIALGAMSLFQIPFTLPSFAALLMLIGFSLDTDILLTMRMIKRKGEPREKAFDALKTGTTMSLAAIIAFGTLFIVSQITHIPTYYEISSVALAGLIGDLFATWGLNAILMIWYLERKEHGISQG